MRYAHLYKILIKTVQNLRLICEKIHIYLYICKSTTLQVYNFTKKIEVLYTK